MSQISATPGITTTTLGDYIRKDGTTDPHTGRIPFSQGLQGNTTSGVGASQASPFLGYHNGTSFLRTGFYWSESGASFTICLEDTNGFQKNALFFDNIGVANWNTIISTALLPDIDGGRSLGSSSFAWNSVVSQNFDARGSNPSITITRTGVDQWRQMVTSGGTFTIENVTDGSRDAFAADGSGGVVLGAATFLTNVAGNFSVTGTTTLASLTGILKGTAGLVSVATAGTDYIAAINVSSPITSTGGGSPNIGFDFSTNNIWTGTNTIKDDVKFYIGDNSQTAGNVSFLNDASSSGNLVIAPENGFLGQFYLDGMSATVEDNFTACTSSLWANVAVFGAALSAPQFTPSGIHGIVSRKQASTAGTGGIAGVLEMEWAGTSSSSSAYQALNLFVHNTSGSASLSSSTSGGGLRSRALTRQRSTSGTIAQMSTYSLILVQDASTGTVSLGSTLNIESPTVGLGSTMTEWRGVSFDVPAAVSGTVGTAKFIHVPSLSGTFGTTQMEVFLDTDAGIFLRESGNQIYSSAAATLDIDTTTTFNNRIGGTVKLALTTTLLDINSAVNVRPNILTASRVVKTDGSKNLVSLTPSSAYTPTNVTTDRSYDANATKVDELADVLGTLIADLQTAGILG